LISVEGKMLHTKKFEYLLGLLPILELIFEGKKESNFSKINLEKREVVE